MSGNTVLNSSGFLGAPVYSQEMLADVVAKKGFHAFQEMSLPATLASTGNTAPCIKHFTGFFTLRQGPDEPRLFLAELDHWQRAIVSIHDYRHEYLLQTAENDALVQRTIEALQRILVAWIDAMPRLKHRISVSNIPHAGLVSIESHKVTGGPDISALTMFLQTYLAAGRLADDIGAALDQATQRQTPVGNDPIASFGSPMPRQAERTARWRDHVFAHPR